MDLQCFLLSIVAPFLYFCMCSGFTMQGKMYSLTDVYYGFAVVFSTFRNTEVALVLIFPSSSLAITAISLSTSAMASRTPSPKTRTTPAATPATASTRSAKTSRFPRFPVLTAGGQLRGGEDRLFGVDGNGARVDRRAKHGRL